MRHARVTEAAPSNTSRMYPAELEPVYWPVMCRGSCDWYGLSRETNLIEIVPPHSELICPVCGGATATDYEAVFYKPEAIPGLLNELVALRNERKNG